MTRDEYENFLARANISQRDIKMLIERILLTEEDILKYIDHVRVFCREYGIRTSSDKRLALAFTRSLVSRAISWRVRNGYKESETVFCQHLPEPSLDAKHEAWRHRDNKEREFRYRSEQRRGFYRNGEPTQTCGEDLQIWINLYEHKTKGKKT